MNYISQKTPLPAGRPLPSAVGLGSTMRGEWSGVIYLIAPVGLDGFRSAATPPPPPRHYYSTRDSDDGGVPLGFWPVTACRTLFVFSLTLLISLWSILDVR